MKKRIDIVQYGLGNVGKKLFELISRINNSELEIRYIGISEVGFSFFDPDGLDIGQIINAKENNAIDRLKLEKASSSMILRKAKENKQPCTVVDVTAYSSTYPTLLEALESGFNVVLANKKPLAGQYSDFERLRSAEKKYDSKLKFGCTVGAGLPVIYTLESLAKTHDTVFEIKGCFSGTLGYIFSELEKRKKFSEIIIAAKKAGYTEPDPREDLSGMDVARKALILARVCGHRLEIEDFLVESLVPQELTSCSILEFLEKIRSDDEKFEKRSAAAKEKGCALKYIATVKDGKAKIALEEIKKDSPIGRLDGPENIFVIRTQRYDKVPLIIQGPGAGIDVTADSVLRNILECN